MFIWRIVKFFIKLAIGIIIGVAVLILIVDSGKDYVRDAIEQPKYNMSYIISGYEMTKQAEYGRECLCPMPDCGKYYIKTRDMKTVCCSQKCEDEYWRLYHEWEHAKEGKDYIESHGVKFQ